MVYTSVPLVQPKQDKKDIQLLEKFTGPVDVTWYMLYYIFFTDQIHQNKEGYYCAAHFSLGPTH